MKLTQFTLLYILFASHPTGVRGLKFERKGSTGDVTSVAPHWGAWIEI